MSCNYQAISVQDLGKKYLIPEVINSGTEPISFYSRLLRKLTYGMALGRSRKRELWALDDVSFAIQQGEAVGVIGNNGAGKSTLLKILSRITSPTKGSVSIRGKVGSLLEVGTGFHPELSGRDNIFLNGAILGMRRHEIKRHFDEIVSFAEIEKFIDTPVKHYSSGMYVRLAFAVAAHLDTDILIVDEVLAVGDINFQKKCLSKLDNVTQTGRTVLFVSHNLPSVRKLCQRGIVFENGKIAVDAPITEAINQYYLSSNRSGSTVIKWEGAERPGNANVKIKAIRLTDTKGNSIPSIQISSDAVIEIEYEVVVPNTKAGFSIVVYNSEGYEVFSSMSNQEPNYYGKTLPAGNYTSCCTLYGNLLNEGKYMISIGGFLAQWQHGFTVDRVLTVEAIDDGVLKGDYPGGFVGWVRPALKWITTKEES